VKAPVRYPSRWRDRDRGGEGIAGITGPMRVVKPDRPRRFGDRAGAMGAVGTAGELEDHGAVD